VFVGQTPDSSGGDVLVFNKGRYVDVSRGVYDSAAPSLSPSGAAVAFSAYRSERGIEPVYGIDIYSFARRRRILLTSERDWSDWAPQWSPDGRYIAFVRSKPQEAMYMGRGEIWVMGSNGQDPRPVASTGMGVTWVG
jgi:Tol biopolymer transport system component